MNVAQPNLMGYKKVSEIVLEGLMGESGRMGGDLYRGVEVTKC